MSISDKMRGPKFAPDATASERAVVEAAFHNQDYFNVVQQYLFETRPDLFLNDQSSIVN